jgi:DNA-binding NarL/FixJ family response regulator
MAAPLDLRDFCSVANDTVSVSRLDGLPSAGARQRVLIVDDSAGFRGLLQLALGALPGVEIVAEAADGEQAIAEVVRTNPDLVLMDVRMPHVNGLQATKQLRSEGKSMRIVLLTAHGDAIPGWLAEEAGADEVLDKSKLGERLREAVSSGVFFQPARPGKGGE